MGRELPARCTASRTDLGFPLTSTGKYESAIAEADKAIALDPDITPAYLSRALNQLFLNGLFSLHMHDATKAIEALQTASRFDLALGGIGFIGRFGGLYPIYVRGLAYLAARQPVEAAAEFQRILDHRSIVLVDPVDAMARLQLARALASDAVKANTAYHDLFSLWKHADPDTPVLKQARAEYLSMR